MTIKIDIVDTNVVFQLEHSTEGYRYQLQARPDLLEGGWQNLLESSTSGGGAIRFESPFDPSENQRFFRISVRPPRGWQLIDSAGPSGGGIAAYDSDRNVAVMFACVGSYPNDTWEFSASGWRQINVSGPHGRDSSGKMVYDEFHKKMFMQGGWWPDTNDPWTWEYRVTGEGPDDRAWVNVAQADCAYRGANCLVYDSTRHLLFTFGGNHWQSFYNDTWSYDPAANSWTPLINWGPSRFAAGLVYDSKRDRCVMFGGSGRWWAGDTEQGRGNTCEFNPQTLQWTEVLPQGAPGVPGPRWFPTMAFDPVAGVTFMMGGGRNSDGYGYTDAWEWNGTSWTEIPTIAGQPTGGSIWFDSARQKLVLFSAPNTYEYNR